EDVIAVAELDGVLAQPADDQVRPVAGRDVVVAGALDDHVGPIAELDVVVAVVELDVVVAVPVADDGGDGQAARELEVVVAAEADHVNGGEGLGVGLVVDIDVIELAIDVDAGAARLAGADRCDVELIVGVAANEVESIAHDGGAWADGDFWRAASGRAHAVVVAVAAVAGYPLIGAGDAGQVAARRRVRAVAGARHRVGGGVNLGRAQVQREDDRAGREVGAGQGGRVANGRGRRAQGDV